jgi:hypothetical protein
MILSIRVNIKRLKAPKCWGSAYHANRYFASPLVHYTDLSHEFTSPQPTKTQPTCYKNPTTSFAHPQDRPPNPSQSKHAKTGVPWGPRWVQLTSMRLALGMSKAKVTLI